MPSVPIPPQTEAAAAAVRPRRLVTAFSALRHYNFRLYFFGLLISVSGSWAQTVAQEWLVYELTGSALVLGQVSFVMAIPVWLLSPWAGVVIDRVPRRTLLFITQLVQMIQAFALAILTFSGRIEVWHIMVLAVLRGIANAFDAPTRQSFYVELVERADLSNAIAMNSTLMSLARIIGPGIGGVIVATVGTAWAFTINGISFLTILIALILMKLARVQRQPASQSPLKDYMEGLRYIWNKKTIFALMIIVLVVALFGASFSVLLPVVAVEVLGKGEIEFGLLNTARGIGSMAGAVIVAYWSTAPRRGRYLNAVNLLLPVALFVFAISKSYPLSLIVMVAIGAGLTPQLSLSNMLIQSHIPDAIRGRVMSVYTLVIFGTFPVGNLIAGAMAEWVGVPLTIALSAIIVLVVSIALRISVPQLARME